MPTYISSYLWIFCSAAINPIALPLVGRAWCLDCWQSIFLKDTTKWWSSSLLPLSSYFRWHIMLCMCHHFIHRSRMPLGGDQQQKGGQRSSIPVVQCTRVCCLHRKRSMIAVVAAAQRFLVSQKCFAGWLISTQTFSIDVLALLNLSHLSTISTLTWMVSSILVHMVTMKMKL